MKKNIGSGYKMAKIYLEENVHELAKKRIREQIIHFPDFYVSFSGGKDSGVLVNLVIDVARELNRLPVKVVFSDLEIIFEETVRYTKSIMEMEEVEPIWLCLEEIDDNSSSIFQRYFKFWGEEEKEKWIRPMPDMAYVINKYNIPKKLKKFYIDDQIDHWTLTKIGDWLCEENNIPTICNFVGMRAAESYGRHMNVKAMKNRSKRNCYTYTYNDSEKKTWISLPIYDWTAGDIWKFYSDGKLDYNKVYDGMYKAGLTESQMRTCSAFGEEQKKSLYLWSILEPQTWEKMVTRVAGANFGKIYNHTNLNRMQIRKKNISTWKEYTSLLLESIPKEAAEIFQEKFDITFRYHKLYYFEKEGISPDVYIQDSRKDIKEAMKKYNLSNKYFICYEDFANAIIKRDFVFKKYGFSYSKKMDDKIKQLHKKYENL